MPLKEGIVYWAPPDSILRYMLSCWGQGLPLLVQILREVVSPRWGTERELDSLRSHYPLETQPVEYWDLRILRLSLCFLSGDSGQWGVCVRGVEGGQVSPR